MAYTTINKSTANFNTLLYTATGTQSVTGAGFQPDISWVKPRSATGSHYIADAVRGATKTISSNNTSAEGTQNLFTSFTAVNNIVPVINPFFSPRERFITSWANFNL